VSAPSIDDYLAGLPAGTRAALQQLREQIHGMVPEARETMLRGMPAFQLDGRWFLGFGAGKGHCSFYTGGVPLEAAARDLTAFRVLKGTIHFRPDRPLPTELVALLVGLRLAERRSP
jgi:uncharacterized protein YdhG (YjbR/CyaY superfamily)